MSQGKFQNVNSISIRKEKTGYSINIGGKRVDAAMATNFEWRMENPVSIKHIYFGTESGEFEGMSFNIIFENQVYVEISNPDARCYIYLSDN